MKNEEFLNELKNVISKYHQEDNIEVEYYSNGFFYWWNGDMFIQEEDETLKMDEMIKEGKEEEAKSLNKFFEEKMPPVKYMKNNEIL